MVVIPEAVDSVSQAALSERLHESVPPLEFVRLRSWAAGFVLPAMPEKLNAAGESRMVGVAVEDCVNDSDTGTMVLTSRPLKLSVAMTTVEV